MLSTPNLSFEVFKLAISLLTKLQQNNHQVLYASPDLLEADYSFCLMKMQFTERLDSDQIRQGLISIRNTQLELLNELKYETEILKNYSPPSTHSGCSERTSFDWRKNRNLQSIQHKSSPQDNDTKLTLSQSQPNTHDKQLRDEINYLKNENKLLISNLNKLKQSLQASKDANSEIQATLALSFRIYYEALLQILDDANLGAVREFILGQICKIPQQKGKMKSYFDDVLTLLSEKEKGKEETSKSKAQFQSQKDIANQLIDLKQQISLLITHSNHTSNIASEQEIARLKQAIDEKSRIIEEKDTIIEKMQSENREIRKNWERQLFERKRVTTEWEAKKKEISTFEEKEKKIIFYAKDMESKAQKAEKILKEKEQTQKILKDNANKQSQTISVLRQTNESLRMQVKTLQETHEKKYSSLLEAKKNLQDQLKAAKLQQSKIIESKQVQLHSLRSHLTQIKRNQQALKQMDKRMRGSDIVQQELYWKKVNVMRINSTIDHLWQVKEVQYENIHELLSKLKR